MSNIILQTAENSYQDIVNHLYNSATCNGAQVSINKETGNTVIRGASKITKYETGEERLSLDDCEEIELTENRAILHDCPFNEVLFFDFYKDMPDHSLAFSDKLVSFEWSNWYDKPVKIGDTCFSYCPSLSYIKLPNGLTEIGREAFAHCPALGANSYFPGRIELPNTVKHIGEQAFFGCYSLRSIEVAKDCVIDGEVDGHILNGYFRDKDDEYRESYIKIIRK